MRWDRPPFGVGLGEISSSLEFATLSTKYPVISSSLTIALEPLTTIADVYPASGVLDPEVSLDSADFRLVARPYMLTDLRREGRRGRRDLTTEGSMAYRIEASLV
jgi:hypothetical protein